MAKRWTKKQERIYRGQLYRLYVRQNKPIKEVGSCLGIAQQTVFQRLKRLGIPATPGKKARYCNKRRDVIIPRYSANLAEFFGIMLGDGKLSHFQVAVTLGTKEMSFAIYIASLIRGIFGFPPKIAVRSNQCKIVYFGSVDITRWLLKKGLVFNKVKKQVDVPAWIFSKKTYMARFLRGFFDTDGSVYRLRHGVQISFVNNSAPLLVSLRRMLARLGYGVSKISGNKIYVTKFRDVKRFFNEIRPGNEKHRMRFEALLQNNKEGCRGARF